MSKTPITDAAAFSGRKAFGEDSDDEYVPAEVARTLESRLADSQKAFDATERARVDAIGELRAARQVYEERIASLERNKAILTSRINGYEEETKAARADRDKHGEYAGRMTTAATNAANALEREAGDNAVMQACARVLRKALAGIAPTPPTETEQSEIDPVQRQGADSPGKAFTTTSTESAHRAPQDATGALPSDEPQPAAQSAPATNARSRGADDIAAERARQIEREGWNATHDEEHDGYELSSAAMAYIEHAKEQGPLKRVVAKHVEDAIYSRLWPWDRMWWKPRDPRRNLVRAGALIAAEIDRLDRASASRFSQDPVRETKP